MILVGLKTERFHNYQEGDCGKPIDRKGIHLRFYKKVFYILERKAHSSPFGVGGM